LNGIIEKSIHIYLNAMKVKKISIKSAKNVLKLLFYFRNIMQTRPSV